MALKIAEVNKKFILSGIIDASQEKNTTIVGFNNTVFKVFETKNEAEAEKELIEVV